MPFRAEIFTGVIHTQLIWKKDVKVQHGMVNKNKEIMVVLDIQIFMEGFLPMQYCLQLGWANQDIPV